MKSCIKNSFFDMKVALLADSISTQQAGIHYFGKSLIRHIIHNYPKHEYIIFSTSIIEEFSQFEQVILPIKKWPPFHFRLRQLFILPKEIRRRGCQIAIELAHFGPFFLPKSIARITVIHDISPVLLPAYHNGLSVWIHRLLLPYIVSSADFLICNSAFTKKSVSEHYNYAPSRILIHYPDQNKVAVKGIASTSFPKGKSPYILSVGTIEPRKNYSTLLRAFNDISDQYPNWRLKIVGEWGWKFKALMKEWSRLKHKNRIEFLGYVKRSDLEQLYRGASLFAYTSTFEGFGMPIMEAFQYAIPTVLANNSSLIEVGGKAALFYETFDVKDLVRKLTLLIENQLVRENLITEMPKQLSRLAQSDTFTFLKT